MVSLVAYGGSDYYGEIRDAWSRGISLSIIEVGFIQNDLSKIQANIDGIGWLIAKYIANICGVEIKKPVAATSTTDIYYRVVVGSFKDRTNAVLQQEKLKKSGYDSFIEAYKK